MSKFIDYIEGRTDFLKYKDMLDVLNLNHKVYENSKHGTDESVIDRVSKRLIRTDKSISEWNVVAYQDESELMFIVDKDNKNIIISTSSFSIYENKLRYKGTTILNNIVNSSNKSYRSHPEDWLGDGNLMFIEELDGYKIHSLREVLKKVDRFIESAELGLLADNLSTLELLYNANSGYTDNKYNDTEAREHYVESKPLVYDSSYFSKSNYYNKYNEKLFSLLFCKHPLELGEYIVNLKDKIFNHHYGTYINYLKKKELLKNYELGNDKLANKLRAICNALKGLDAKTLRINGESKPYPNQLRIRDEYIGHWDFNIPIKDIKLIKYKNKVLFEDKSVS